MGKPTRRRLSRRRYALTLPELEHSKAAVLNSLGSLQSRRSYKHAIEEFIRWYCSEPRLALNRAVVLRYRLHLENIPLAPSTINARLAAIRRIAYEAADTGLLSPELVAGIRRVKGIKRLGQPVGNWLTAHEGRQLLVTSGLETLRGKGGSSHACFAAGVWAETVRIGYAQIRLGPKEGGPLGNC